MSISNPETSVNVEPGSEVTIVDAKVPFGMFDWLELWRYRELIWIFADRDIKVRYRQTVVGIAWTVLQPLAKTIAFTSLFSVTKSKAFEGDHPGVVIFCGILLYQLFTGILGASTLCLVDNRQMVTKVYFPRVVLPLSSCLRPLLDFGIGLMVLIGLMIWYQVVPSAAVILSPVVVALTVITGVGLGLWLSALNAHYRDFGFVVPFLLELGLIASPVFYPSSFVQPPWRWLYYANPMSSLLDAFRWTLFGYGSPSWVGIAISFCSLLFLLGSGAWYFRRVEGFLADNI